MRKLKRRLFLKLFEACGNSSQIFSPHGIEIFIPKDADIDIRYLLAKGRQYEQEEAEFVKQYIEPGTDVIEFGGCMGIVSALIRKQIGPDAHHTIVEANSDLAKICKTNALKYASNETVDVIVAAVDYTGAKTVTFSLGHNAHVGHLAKSGEDGISVPTTTLSQVASKTKMKNFAFVCDIEGAEIALFEHEKDVFESISTIILETHPSMYPNENDLDNMKNRLSKLGFALKKEINNVLCLQRA